MGAQPATARTLDAASTAHTTDPINRAAAVYRLDLIARASTPACYGRADAPGISHGGRARGGGATARSRDRPIMAGLRRRAPR